METTSLRAVQGKRGTFTVVLLIPTEIAAPVKVRIIRHTGDDDDVIELDGDEILDVANALHRAWRMATMPDV